MDGSFDLTDAMLARRKEREEAQREWAESAKKLQAQAESLAPKVPLAWIVASSVGKNRSRVSARDCTGHTPIFS